MKGLPQRLAAFDQQENHEQKLNTPTLRRHEVAQRLDKSLLHNSPLLVLLLEVGVRELQERPNVLCAMDVFHELYALSASRQDRIPAKAHLHPCATTPISLPCRFSSKWH